MKKNLNLFLMIICSFCVIACDSSAKEVKTKEKNELIPAQKISEIKGLSVYKIEDKDGICYFLYYNHISCFPNNKAK